MAERIMRDDVVRAVRVHYVLDCMRDLQRDGTDTRGHFRGGWVEGSYVYFEGGAHLSVRWDAPAMVGVVFDERSSRNEAAAGDIAREDYQPLRHLKTGLPKDCLPGLLEPLAMQAASAVEDLVTAGFWTATGPITRCSGGPIDTHGWFGLFEPDAPVPPSDDGLGEAQRELARSLGAARSRRELTESEIATLLHVRPSEERIAQIAEALALADIVMR